MMAADQDEQFAEDNKTQGFLIEAERLFRSKEQ